MATISKFYLHEVVSTNTGTLPSATPALGGKLGAGTEATGAATARQANDVIGVASPDTKSVITAAATSGAVQRLGHRRFVTSPLAAHTFDSADGNWTWSYANLESNTSHNGQIFLNVYAWRPSTGAAVGANSTVTGNAIVATTEAAVSKTFTVTATTILDGDILVFDIYSQFNQGMATAYTDSYCFDGTVEASTTTCATFVSPPAALTLFTSGTTYTKAGYGVEHG